MLGDLQLRDVRADRSMAKTTSPPRTPRSKARSRATSLLGMQVNSSRSKSERSATCRERQPKRASLGVLADRPCAAWMDHAAAERLDLFQRLGQIIYGEVGQGEGVARPATPRMDPNRWLL